MNVLTSSLIFSAVLLSGTAAASTKNVPGDFTTVQQAVDAAAAGDTIMIMPGRYLEHVVITTPGITLDGSKAVIDGSYSGLCLSVHADNVTLLSLTFDNGGPTAGDASLEPGGLLVVGTGEHIQRCKARSCSGFGIKLVGDGEVFQSEAIACQGPGLVVESGNPAGPSSRLTKNEVHNCSEGIVVLGGPVQMDHNSSHGNAGNGISVTISGTGTVQLGSSSMSHDDSSGNQGTGLLVNDELGGIGLIEHADLVQNGIGLDVTALVAGLQLNDIDVTENSVGGVHLRTLGAEFSNSRVQRNTNYGIVVESANGAADGNNTVRGSKILANGGDGVHVTSGANTVRDNYIKDSYGDGLQIAAGDRNTVSYNQVLNSRNDGLDNWGTNTLLTSNNAFNNAGADLAGLGDGNGTVDAASTGNTTADLTGLGSLQELELATLF
jgi:hypothetical protein